LSIHHSLPRLNVHPHDDKVPIIEPLQTVQLH